MICETCTKQSGCRTLPVKKGDETFCDYYVGSRFAEKARQDAEDMVAPRRREGQTHIADSGNRTEFATGAVRDMHAGKGRMDLLPWAAIMEVSKHCEEGALKYGERNIDKGLPLHSLLDSGMRHLAKYLEGHKDEPHLRSAAWNILWAIQFELTMPEMQDIPNRQEKGQ